MKKHYSKFFLGGLVVLIISSFFLVNVINFFLHNINIDEIALLINSGYFSEENVEETMSMVYNLQVESNTHSKENLLSDQGDVVSALQLSDGEMCLVIKSYESDKFTLSITSETKGIKLEHNVDYKPEQILEYNNGIIFRQKEDLFLWDYHKENSIELVDILKEYDGGKLWSNGKEIVYDGSDGVYLYIDGYEKKLKSGFSCLGFLDEKTVVFEKDMPMGFCLINKFDITNNKYYGFKLLYMPGYIVSGTAFSPNGKYMLCFSSNGEGGLETFIFDMNYYTRKKINLDVDVVSLQWLQNKT